MNTELWLNHSIAGSNKHDKSAKDIRFTDLVKNNMSRFSIRKQCLEQANNMLQELIMANKGMHESTNCIDQMSFTDHEPKRIRKYDGTHVNIASFINRFQQTKHGI